MNEATETASYKIKNKKKTAEFFEKNKYIMFSFVIPFLIMLTAFAVRKMTPFGDQQILVTDSWHQYFPFLSDLQDKLKNGESLFWSWTQGGGVNYFSLMSYYLASPMNFLSVFIPKAWLNEFLMLEVVTKIALAGMFMAIFLRSMYRKNDFSLVLFGCSFSFCAFFMGYYWNSIWLDTVCLTPLVVLGAVKLLTEKKYRLFVISLSVSLIANYYIGLFTCIFVLLVFICYSIVEWKDRMTFFENLIRMAVFSLIAIGITAFFLLPAFFGLQNTYASGSSFPRDFAINIGKTNDLKGVLYAVKAVFSNFISFDAPNMSAAEALPNIACGTVGIVFAFLFLSSDKIKVREKLVSAGLILFMVFSCIIRWLDYILHGFHFTNMIPYRFSYLISFVVIVMAFRAFTLLDTLSVKNVLLAALGTVHILWFAYECEQEAEAVGGTFALAFVILMLLLFYTNRVLVSGQVLAVVLAVLVLGECGFAAYTGVKTTGSSSADIYPRGGEAAKDMFAYMKEQEKDTTELWRAESTNHYTCNDGSLNGYHGLSMFNSMANMKMSRFAGNLGMRAWTGGNSYLYAESSPVTNMFLNLKYVFAIDAERRNTYDLTETFGEENCKLYRNEHYIPMGFMTKNSLADWVENEEEDTMNSFDTQAEFFRLATGIEEPLYVPVEVQTQKHTDASQFNVVKTAYGTYNFNCIDSSITPTLKWNYEAPQDGIYYMNARIPGKDEVTVTRRTEYGAEEETRGTFNMKRGHIACIGEYKKGEIISLSATLPQNQSGTARVYVNWFNPTVFEQAYENLSKDVMTTTSLTGNSMKGIINVSEDGLFYTSIPYEKGWSAKVDGKKTEITPVGGSVVAFPLTAGNHEIELKFYPRGFRMGVVISLFCIGLFVLVCFAV